MWRSYCDGYPDFGFWIGFEFEVNSNCMLAKEKSTYIYIYIYIGMWIDVEQKWVLKFKVHMPKRW